MAGPCEAQNGASVEFALRNAFVQENWRPEENLRRAPDRTQSQRSKAGWAALPRVTE
jgi:hypothetical protein